MTLVTSTVVIAAVVPAGVTAAVVAALNVGVVFQRSVKQGFCGSIGAAGYAAVQFDAGFGQSVLRSSADTSADQRIHIKILQKTGQSAVTAAGCVFYS